MFIDKNDPEGRIQCVSALGQLFSTETDPQNYLRSITALGNLCYGDQEVRQMVDALGVKVDISNVQGADEKTLGRIKEIGTELKLI